MKEINTIVIAVGGKSGRLSEYFKAIDFQNTKTLFPVKGHPQLKYLIDIALAVGFQRIFLLASYYENRIQEFVNYYYKDQSITVISGGEEGKKGGVAAILSLIENRLKAPFVYSDGDILFEQSLLKELRFKNKDGVLVKCVISLRDSAATHSKFIISNNKISKIKIRCDNLSDKRIEGHCSLGLMIIDHRLFSFIPEYKETYDLDLLVKKIFEKNTNLVGYKIYDGDWFSIHTKQDIDIINKGRYNSLLSSLTYHHRSS